MSKLHPALLLQVLGVGFAAGLLSGFFGVGGGIILVPLILLVLKADQHTAHATSLAAIFLIAVSGVVGYATAGEVDLTAGIFMGIGGLVGGTLGARMMHRMSVPVLQGVFAVVLIVAGVRMVL